MGHAQRLRKIVALCVLMLGVLVFFAFRPSLSPAQKVQRLISQCPLHSPHATYEDSPCIQEAVQNILASYAPHDAEGYIESSVDPLRCHLISHVVGAQLYSSEKDLEHTMALCGNVCGQGCAHGAIGEAFREQIGTTTVDVDLAHMGMPEITALGGRLCQNIVTCHGIGHVLFQELNSIASSTALCRKIAHDRSQANACFRGIYMENAFDVYDREASLGLFDRSDVLYPCDKAPRDELHACFTFLPKLQDRIFEEAGSSQEQTLAQQKSACESVRDAAGKTDCFEGIGFHNAPLVISNPAAAEAVCEHFSETYQRNSCIYGMTYISAMGDSSAVRAFCAGLKDTTLTPVCARGIEEHIAIVKSGDQ